MTHSSKCNNHKKIRGSINRIVNRLGKMEIDIDTHSEFVNDVEKELKALNAWVHKRDGVTIILMCVITIIGTLFMFVVV